MLPSTTQEAFISSLALGQLLVSIVAMLFFPKKYFQVAHS